MTKFDELMGIITRNKNKKKFPESENFSAKTAQNNEDDDIEIEVSGSESAKGPLVATASEEMDPDIIDMLYTKPRNVPNRGENASSWDSDY